MTDGWELPKLKPITEERLTEAMLAEAMESVSAYEGQDGFWYAVVHTDRGLYLEGPFDAEDIAQEMGLSLVMLIWSYGHFAKCP